MSDLDEEEDALVHMGYKGHIEYDCSIIYAPFNPFMMSERDEVLSEIELIEDEREKQEAKRKAGRK